METKGQLYYSSAVEINNLMPDYSNIELNANNPSLSLNNNYPSTLNYLNIENNEIIINDKYNNINQNNNIEIVYSDNMPNNNTINENIYLQPEINGCFFSNFIEANNLNNNINSINTPSYNNNIDKDKILADEVDNNENKNAANNLTSIEDNSSNLKDRNINNSQIKKTDILPVEEKSLKDDKQNVEDISQNNKEIKEKTDSEKNGPEKKKYIIKGHKKPKIKTSKKICFCCCYSILWCLKFFTHG